LTPPRFIDNVIYEVSMKKKISIKIKPYWNEMDALGHINNARYATYFEEARVEWLKVNGLMYDGWDRQETGPVIINANYTYLKMVKHPAELEIFIIARNPGRSSFIFEYEILDKEGLVAKGDTKVVWVNYSKAKSVPLPDEVRKLIQP